MLYIKRTIKIITFILGLGILLRLTSILFMPKTNKPNAGIEESNANGILGEKENTIDVVVLGDSETYSAFSPLNIWNEAGYTMYVCGTNGQTLDYSLNMLERSFEKQHPKIVILETNAIYRKVSKSNAFIMQLGKSFSIFDYHDRWKSLTKADFSTVKHFTWSDDTKGYRYNNTIEPSYNTDYMKNSEKISKIPKINERFLKKIKDCCDKHGAKLILISSPSSKNWKYPHHNGIQKIANELGCDYLDLNLLNDQLSIDWSHDTRDKGDHLNYYGAKKVSTYVASYLQGLNMLADHRDDANYVHWNDSYKKFKLTIAD